MKLSVSAFRAHASARKKIFSHAPNLNYGATSSSSHMSSTIMSDSNRGALDDEETHFGIEDSNRKESQTASPPNRTKSNQRWMKLRTTVQISGAITSTVQKKPPLKREDSFLKRFSTRQIPELEETIDIGEDGNGDGERENSFQATARINRKKRKQKPPWSVVNPDGDFFYYWMFLVTICVLYNLWTLIVRQSFPELQEGYSEYWMSIDVFSDSVFLFDVVVQFRTGYLEQGLMVYDSKKLSGHYMKSRAFFLDLAALFPLELLQLKYGSKPILRFPRFLKVHRVYRYYYIVESRTVYPNLLRVVNLIHILLILAHWFGCFYYLISEAEGFQGDWAYPYRPGPFATVTRKYLGSLYWSTLTLTTIGDLPTPETNVDRETDRLQNLLRRGHKSRLLQFRTNQGYVFTIVGYLIGVFIFATIVGQVGNVITNRNANRLEFERLLDGAKTFMRYHKVPGGMKKRVLRWYDYSWSRGRIQGGGDINTALGLLPDKLKTELALHVNLSVLKKVTIFQECQPEFLHDLVLKMKAYIFTPGDLICRKGEVAREMFIIADGILEVMSETGRVLTTMRAGDFFGEIGILNLDGLNKRTADVRSVGYSELFSLSREDVLNAMKDYPEAQEILQSLGRKRLKEAQNINRALKSSAFKLKEKKAMSVLHMPQPSSDTACKSRLDKLRSDVKELRNALRKGSKTSRFKADDLDLEPLDNQRDSELSAPTKNVLHRMTRIYSNENPPETDNPTPPPTSPKLGAGLPLLQRLKILKEKQEREKLDVTSKIETIGTSSTEPNSSTGPSVPLLQRISLLKQSDESKSNALLNTATKTAQVLASTVRTQRDTESGIIELKAYSPKESRFKAIASFGGTHRKPPSTWVTVCRESRADQVKKVIPHQSEASIENESWNLLKKAVILPSNTSTDIAREAKEATFEEAVKNISIIDSNNGENKMKIAQVDSAQELNKETQILTPSEIGNLAHITDEMKSPVAPKSPRCFSSLFKRKKIYRSIDDLSPEYCGLPFVKKLKILNERQKLAELEKERSIRSCSLDSRGGADGVCDTSALSRSHSETSAMDMVLRNQQLRDETSTLRPLKLDVATETIGFLSSTESNETLERKTLKTLLKKFSSASWVDPEKLKNDPTLQSNLRQLMRAQTVEGYAARHSKFRTVSINKRPFDSPSPTSTCDTMYVKSSESKPSCSFRQSPASQEVERTNESGIRRINPDVIPKKVSMCIISEESFSGAVSPFREEPSSLPKLKSPSLPEPVSNRELNELGVAGNPHHCGELFVEVKRLLEEYAERFLRNCTSDLLLEFLQRDKMIQCLEKRIVELERRTISEVPKNETASECLNELTDRAEQLALFTGRNLFEETLSDSVVDLTGVESSSSNSDDDSTNVADPFPFHWEDHMLAQQLVDREDNLNQRRTASLDYGRRSLLTKQNRRSSIKMKLMPDQTSAPGSLELINVTSKASAKNRRSMSISHIQKTFTSSLRKGYRFIKKAVPPSPDVVPSLSFSRHWKLPSSPSTTFKPK